MDKDKKPTINDIAEFAGVSKATVSHVLSGKRYISPETKTRVMRIIAEKGYQPNPDAVALTRNRNNPNSDGKDRISIKDVAGYIGVSVTTVSHAINRRRPVSTEMVELVERAIDILGYQPRTYAQNLNSLKNGKGLSSDLTILPSR